MFAGDEVCRKGWAHLVLRNRPLVNLPPPALYITRYCLEYDKYISIFLSSPQEKKITCSAITMSLDRHFYCAFQMECKIYYYV